MVRKLLETIENTLVSTSKQSYILSEPPPPPQSNLQSSFNFDNKVSPSIMLIIIILAIIFFVSGLLHLLVRFLLRPSNRDTDDLESVTALQGQLQQLFHLHDSGVDQSYIDTLPVFHYKAIIGLKNPFDCAVCLCEFEPDDKLRLLPKCSHAFHMECIDTWLLSHSTCPLCRASLLQDFSPNNSCSPVVLVLESGSESSREITGVGEGDSGIVGGNSQRLYGEEEFGSSEIDLANKSHRVETKEEETQKSVVDFGDKVVTVKLGKFRNVDGGEGCSTINVDERRCFSMGSFAYVMDESSSLQVPIRTPLKKQSSNKPALPLKPGQRAAISECDCDSRREFDFNRIEPHINFDNPQTSSVISEENRNSNKKESFSVSKIWLRGKKENQNGDICSSRRASSSRFPLQRSNGCSGEDLKNKNERLPRRTVSEIDVGRWEKGRFELGGEEENQSSNSLDSQSNLPSFARRTLLWLMGRQNKVVHSSSIDPNL
ncbi:hypothetical protein UlMin_004112 [Ulmus minor]